MSAGRDSVNGSMLISTPKTYLTLSAVGEVAQPRDGGLTEPVEAALRDERDTYTPGLLAELDHYTENELRALWGDR